MGTLELHKGNKIMIDEFSGEYLESMELLLEVLRLWGNRAKEECHKRQKS